MWWEQLPFFGWQLLISLELWISALGWFSVKLWEWLVPMSWRSKEGAVGNRARALRSGSISSGGQIHEHWLLPQNWNWWLIPKNQTSAKGCRENSDLFSSYSPFLRQRNDCSNLSYKRVEWKRNEPFLSLLPLWEWNLELLSTVAVLSVTKSKFPLKLSFFFKY